MEYFQLSSLLARILFLILYILGHGNCMPLQICPGPCVSVGQCGFHGGVVRGPCGKDGKICCEYPGRYVSCGQTTHDVKVSDFVSPGYPHFGAGSLVCNFEMMLSGTTTGVRIDFLDFKMESTPVGADFFETESITKCESDMFFIKGFKDWTPDARCGNLTGFSTVVELEPGQPTISLVFVMSSLSYKWHVRLTQITFMEIEAAEERLRLKNLELNNALSENRIKREHGNTDDGTDSEFKEMLTGSESNRIPLIGGGSEAKPNSIPWQISIQTVKEYPSTTCEGKNMSWHLCGGSIIDETTILTASHCVLTGTKFTHPLNDISELKVVVGEHDLCQADEVTYTRTFSIASIIFHDNYLSAIFLNDIAIIKLAEPIQFNEAVRPIEIAYPGIAAESMTALLSGWGSLETDLEAENLTYPAILQETTKMKILPDSQCLNNTMEYLKLNKEQPISFKFRSGVGRGVCAVAENGTLAGAGFGDSGGPLAVLDVREQRYYLLGVVSHTRIDYPDGEEESNTNSTRVDYFAKVSEYGTWILMGMVPKF